MIPRSVAIALSVATGALLELVIGALSGRREAWDSAIYWTQGLPVAMLAAGLIGFVSARRDWLWTAAVVPSQVTAMMFRNGDILGSLGLWPLMVALTSVLSAPFVVAAFLGSRFRRRPDA
jgi:hypothetical protein